LLHFSHLLLLEVEDLLPLLHDFLAHLHRLLKVLVAVLQDLLQGLLVHADHLLLVLEHLACLALLLGCPV